VLCSDDPAIVPNQPNAGFDTYEGTGVGRYNGVDGATASWRFTDAGEPGTSDTAQITIWDADGNQLLKGERPPGQGQPPGALREPALVLSGRVQGLNQRPRSARRSVR
jgi:hypothetical protein